jgi:hypothetical protein
MAKSPEGRRLPLTLLRTGAITSRPDEQGVDLDPQLLPRGTFIFRQHAQGLCAADAGEIGVLLPMVKRPLDGRPGIVRLLVEQFSPRGYLDPQP